MYRVLLFCLLVWPVWAGAQAIPFVNWENAPVHPIDLSPDGRTLVVTNTPDNRLEVFDLTTGTPRLKASIVVGIDPVSVRFLDDDEVWVANHISDSISVVDLESLSVRATIPTLDEPADVVFAGAPLRAFVSCSAVDIVQVFNPSVCRNLRIRQWNDDRWRGVRARKC
jgi:YVTN family beta-propeller protein